MSRQLKLKFSINLLAAMCCCFLMSSPYAAPRIDLETPPDVPENISGRAELLQTRTGLLNQQQNTYQMISRQAEHCHAVVENSPLVTSCKEEGGHVVGAIRSYRLALKEFKAQLHNGSCQSLRDQLNEMNAAAARASLAQDVYYFYQSTGGMTQKWKAPAGFTVISNNLEMLRRILPDKSKAQIIDLFSPSGSAYRAAIYRDDNSGALILAFRGTTEDLNNWTGANIPNALKVGSESAYFERAEILGRALKSYSDNNGVPFEIVGHSLGGALAAWAGINSGAKVTTFNAENVNGFKATNYDVGKINNQITNYVVSSEVVTAIQGSNQALGRKVVLPLPDADNYATGSILRPIGSVEGSVERHGISTVRIAVQFQIDSLNNKVVANQCNQ